MSDPQHNRPQGQDNQNTRPDDEPTEHKRSFLGRLAGLISQHAPENRDELRSIIVTANKDGVIDEGTQVMIEGAMRLADMTAVDAMVPTSRVEMFDINTDIRDIVDLVLDGGHSRFPVYEPVGEDDDENRQNVIGILIAKDLLKLERSPDLNIRTLLRPPHFVPESRTLNRMLTDFKEHRQHMALVVDEFGRISGILTIEDVIEEIVGEIEDEFDFDEDEGDIFALTGGGYRVAGDASLEYINETFEEHIESDEVETIGGYISHELGHVPRQGESCIVGKMKYTVLLTRAGLVRWFKAEAVDH
ncbi:MAG: CBS domain-containing protein [Saezia sp.]